MLRAVAPRAVILPSITVLDGLTGTGKTQLLRELAARGEAVLDLEALAQHRGSAFGDGGEQPTHRVFQRRVDAALAEATSASRLWIEYSGPFLGSVGLPPELFAAMERAPRIVLTRPREERIARIARDQSLRPVPALLASIRTVLPRAGRERSEAAVRALTDGAIETAVGLMLEYYDAAYERRLARAERIATVPMDCAPGELIELATRTEHSEA